MVFSHPPNQDQKDLANAMGPPPKPPKKKGLFSGGITLGHKKPEETHAQATDEFGQELNSVSRRLRLLEDRTQNLRQKVQLIDQSAMETHKKLLAEIKTNSDDIKELKHAISEIQNKVLLLVKELRLSAKKEDVDVLMKYMELWQPQNFVTREQVEKIMQQMLEQYTH